SGQRILVLVPEKQLFWRQVIHIGSCRQHVSKFSSINVGIRPKVLGKSRPMHHGTYLVTKNTPQSLCYSILLRAVRSSSFNLSSHFSSQHLQLCTYVFIVSTQHLWSTIQLSIFLEILVDGFPVFNTEYFTEP